MKGIGILKILDFFSLTNQRPKVQDLKDKKKGSRSSLSSLMIFALEMLTCSATWNPFPA
jgi:hypothetical protein